MVRAMRAAVEGADEPRVLQRQLHDGSSVRSKLGSPVWFWKSAITHRDGLVRRHGESGPSARRTTRPVRTTIIATPAAASIQLDRSFGSGFTLPCVVQHVERVCHFLRVWNRSADRWRGRG